MERVATQPAMSDMHAMRDEPDMPAEKDRGADGSAAAAPARLTIRERMREDVDAVMRLDPSAESRRDVFLHSNGLHAVWAYRVQHWLWQRGRKGLAMFLARRSRRRYGVEIHPAATIGRRLVIDHGMGIVIGATTIIGDDCLIYQGVTLGMTGKHTGKRHPTLGDDVMFGANAVVLGNINVGSGAKVGAGAVVVCDVDCGDTVVGVPARPVPCMRHRNAFVLRLTDQLDGENVRWSCAL